MIDEDERVLAAVRGRLDAVTRDIAVPPSPGFAGQTKSDRRPRGPVSSGNPGTLRMLVVGGLAVLLVGIVANGLRPGGDGSASSGRSAETSSAAQATPDGSLVTGAASSASPATSVDLPTHSRPTNGQCPQAHLGPVILRADRSLAQPVYVEHVESGTRRLILLWPYGFTARFDPQLEILDDRGRVVAREGDVLDLGGGVTDQRYDFFACHITRVDP
jgi:hypothetical protein